jgi:hypothetical protein
MIEGIKFTFVLIDGEVVYDLPFEEPDALPFEHPTRYRRTPGEHPTVEYLSSDHVRWDLARRYRAAETYKAILDVTNRVVWIAFQQLWTRELELGETFRACVYGPTYAHTTAVTLRRVVSNIASVTDAIEAAEYMAGYEPISRLSVALERP